MNDAVKQEEAAFTGRSALIIDDNAFMRRLVRSLLRQFGFDDLHEAADGSAALERVGERHFDVVVCDWMMEPTDGYDFARSLRQHPNSSVRTLPVVMLTAVAEQAKVMAARDAGVTEYLVKPVSSGKLRARLIAALTRPRPFVACDSYVGPDRRRRDAADSRGKGRRLTDRLQAQATEQDLADVVASYPDVLRGEIEGLRRAILAVETAGAATAGVWRQVHRIAHDLKGQAPTFGYEVAAEIGGSLERLLRPVVDTPKLADRLAGRRLRAAKTHVEALALMLDQGIVGRSPETDSLAARLTRSVEQVHREAAG